MACLLALCLSLAMFLPTWTIAAQDEYDYIILPDGTAQIIWCLRAADNEVVIPDTLDGYPVSAIGSLAFWRCTNVTRVTIPHGVTNIEYGAFSWLADLEEVDIPTSIISIGAMAFAGTPWLSKQTDTFVVVGDGVLIAYNGSDTHVVIPDGVTYISDVFRSNASITSVILPKSVTCIGEAAFYDCNNLESVVMHGKVTDIEGHAFWNCVKLREINIPSTIWGIGAEAFYANPWLDERSEDFLILGNGILIKYNGAHESVIIPDGVKAIIGAFAGNTSVTSVMIPSSVTEIGYRSFDGCENLTSVQIPGGTMNIGPRAFYNCNGLQSVVIPKSVASLGTESFDGCFYLDDIYFQGKPPASDAFHTFCGDNAALILHYPADLTTYWVPNGDPVWPDGNLAPYLRGNINENGTLHAGDAAKILRWLVRLETLTDHQLFLADVNGDGKVTATDAAAILRYLVRLISSFD